MAKSNTLIDQPNVREIPPDEWLAFLTAFTRENRGAHARLEVFGSDTGYRVVTENLPFDGVTADVKDGEHEAWISFSTSAKNQWTHGVAGATIIRTMLPTETIGPVLEIETKDGTRHLLELTRPGDYELPPSNN